MAIATTADSAGLTGPVLLAMKNPSCPSSQTASIATPKAMNTGRLATNPFQPAFRASSIENVFFMSECLLVRRVRRFKDSERQEHLPGAQARPRAGVAGY